MQQQNEIPVKSRTYFRYYICSSASCPKQAVCHLLTAHRARSTLGNVYGPMQESCGNVGQCYPWLLFHPSETKTIDELASRRSQKAIPPESTSRPQMVIVVVRQQGWVEGKQRGQQVTEVTQQVPPTPSYCPLRGGHHMLDLTHGSTSLGCASVTTASHILHVDCMW